MPQVLDWVSYSFNPYAVPTAATAFAMLVLGVAVLAYERASRESVAFFGLAASVVVWLTGFSVMYSARDPDVAIFWARIGYLGVPAIGPAIYTFCLTALGLPHRRRLGVWIGWALAALFSALALFGESVIAGVYRYPWGPYTRLGPLGAALAAFVTGMILLSLFEYGRHYRSAETKTQRQRILGLGIALGIGGLGAVDFAAAFGVALYPFGYLPVLGFLIITAWVVWYYHLADITPAFAAKEILGTLEDAIVAYDRHGRIRISNAAVETLLGHPRSDVVGAPLARIAGEGLAREALTEIRAGRTMRGLERVLPARAGEAIEASISATPLRMRGGEIVGGVFVARDLRVQKQAALALESEARFRSLVENLSEAITVLHEEGTVRYVSPAFERITGFTAEERVGRSAFDRVHPEDAEAARREFRDLLTRPGTTVRMQARLQHKNGSWHTVELTGQNRLHDSAVQGIVITYNDITDRIQLEEQLRQAQKMEAVGRLAGGIAHDFNNLLTSIQGHTHLLLADGANEGRDDEALSEVIRAADRARDLTRQLLTFSRQQFARHEVIDLNAELREMEKMLGRLIGEHIRFVLDLAPELGHVKIDPGQVQQVVMNLVLNARDAMPDGGAVRLQTRNLRLSQAHEESFTARGDGDPYVMLAVSDTGTGMDEETKKRIFEPFFTTKEQGKGPGLGLATVYGIIEQSGGAVEVESEVGKGTTFRTYLPQVEAPVEREQESQQTTTPPSGATETILVVEDESSVRRLVRKVLGREGYSVLEAENGRHALDIAREHEGFVDLVLTDVVMPEMSGRELAEHLRRQCPKTRIIFMSGYTQDDVVRRGIMQAEVAFLEKPFSPEELASKVREALAGRERLGS